MRLESHPARWHEVRIRKIINAGVQHRNVSPPREERGVKLIVYTSILHADTTLLMLAEEHRDTEAALRESAVPFVLLRNGWYTEV